MLDLVKIGSFIADRRKEAGLTQKQLADTIGVSDKAISRWETGKGMPDTSIMSDLCEALNINVNELLSGECLNADSYSGKAEEIMVNLVKDVHENKSDKKATTYALIIGIILLFLGVYGIAVITGTQIAWLLDIPSLVIVLGIQFIVLGSAGQFKHFIGAFKLIFGKKKADVIDIADEAERCEYALNMAQRSAILAGVLSSIVSFITILDYLWADKMELLGPNLAVAVLSIFYAILIALILMPLRGRLRKMC
jgi:transcriptional regulator with XRE-family HTH domain